MKQLLRSTFVVNPSDEKAHLLLRNFLTLQESRLEFTNPDDDLIWSFITGFVRTHNQVPTINSILSHFQHKKEDTVVNRVKHLEILKVMSHPDFQTRVEIMAEDRRIRSVSELLKTAADILGKGIKVTEGKEEKLIQGPYAAIHHIMDQSHEIVAPTLGGRLSGEVTQDGQDFVSEYERVEADPLAGVGQHTGITQMDNALNGAKRNELWIHAGFTGGLKCLAGDAKIFDLSTGRLLSALELYETQQAPEVHALNEDMWELERAQATRLVQSGVRPIYRVGTDRGREIRVSNNHPFMTTDGWKNAEDLVPGDWVAVAKRLPSHHASPYTDEEVRLVGYLIGDGGLLDNITFTNSSKEAQEDFKRCLRSIGLREARGAERVNYPSFRVVAECPCKSDLRKTTRVIRVSQSAGKKTAWVSPVRALLDRLGLYGTGSADKHISGGLWRMSDDQGWLFVSALWAMDGRIDVEKTKNGGRRPKLWYGSKSESLARGLHLFLQRLGVPSSVNFVPSPIDGEPYPFWTVHVLAEGSRLFLSRLHPAGKEVAVRKAVAALDEETKYEGERLPSSLFAELPNETRVPTHNGWYYAKHAKQNEWLSGWVARRFAEESASPKLRSIVGSPDVRWERVDDVGRDGEEMTYDLSVPGLANFVANGFITHNSTEMLNWAYNQAVFFNHSSLIFSLEMPYYQCRRILYAMHSQHEKFKTIRYKLGLQKHPDDSVGLPYTDIRDGTLDEYHPNAKKFLVEYVVPDLNGKQMVKGINPRTNLPWPDPKDFGKIHIEVADPDKADFTMADLRHKAELIYSKAPYSLIFIDHVGLMAPRKWVSSTTERLNEIIRDCKRMAMSFNRGMGMAVVALFQINREGFKAATKRKEKTGTASYDLTHLSYANEAERCVRISSTYVTSLKGCINIGDVSIGDSVWSSGGWKKVLNKFDNGVRRIWEVKTGRGSILEATAPHRVRVVQDGALDWKAVRDLTSEDYLASSMGGSRWAREDIKLPDLEAGKYETLLGRKGEGELDTPFSTTSTLAYLLGAWDGDGKVHQGGLGWTGNRMEVQVREAIRHAFQATFGHELPFHESPSRPGSFDLVKWSKPLKRWFEQVAGQRAGGVPECILCGTEDVVTSYLRGLFDTDGWVNKNNIIGIKMKEACEPFLRQIQMLLTGLGIDSHLSPNETTLKKTGKAYGGYTLRVVSREGRRRFLEKIGFTEDAKMAVVWDSIKQAKSDKQVYPAPETFLRVYKLVHPAGSPQTRFKRAFYNNPRKVKRTGLVARGAIETLLQAASEDGIDNEDTRFLSKLLELQVMQVESVRDTGIDAPVMDLEVEGDHEYQTGPLLSHNSADIVTSSWVDDDLRAQNRVQFQCLKSRDQKPFEMFLSRVEWPCRRILTCFEVPMTTDQKEAVGDALDQEDIKELDAK